MKAKWLWLLTLAMLHLQTVQAEVGDPQLRTDHPWYPGELALSSFERLFQTQAAAYERVTGVRPVTDEQKAVAAWLWRNTHYFHGEEGPENLWGQGFQEGSDLRSREYWTGQFAHGFGLCGTTHSQWVAEMEALLGHARGRGVGMHGHNAFEVFLTGGEYGRGKWVLLDHDLSTVVFDEQGKSLLSAHEVQQDWKRWTQRSYLPTRQPWLVCGLHPEDGASYQRYTTAEYLAGYSGVPPIVHLRRGERLRRYFQPGLEDGKTFVFWGRNYNAGGIPGPERSLTWVNQPEKMYRSAGDAGHRIGQARYANAVYTYRPDFSTEAYREGVIDEGNNYVVFEFYTPYIIAATPPTSSDWGIFEPGCKNGLVLHGQAGCDVSVSTDQGQTWHEGGPLRGGLDLTDFVKGHRQYFLKLHAGAAALREANLTITTVCQANAAVLPRLKAGETQVTFQASGRAVVSAGPNLPQAQAHVVAGEFGTPRVTLEVATPRGERATAVYAAAHVLSGNPPDPAVKYQIEYSTDAGATWKPVVKDWTVQRRGHEPADFWSQSMCWGSIDLAEGSPSPVQVRFHNDGGKRYARAEVHLVYRVARPTATRVTYAWSSDEGLQQMSHEFAAGSDPQTWQLITGQNPETLWVEMEAL